MDGVGKSTTSKLLAERLGYIYVEKNLHELFDEKDRFDNYFRIRDKVNKSPDRLFTSWFYGLGNIYLHTEYHDKISLPTDIFFLIMLGAVWKIIRKYTTYL